jgi:5-methyltetrahydrofolate--homocysteine methyltransferase
MSDLFQQISEALQKGDDAQVGTLTRQAVEEKHPAKDILDHGLIAGMSVIGKKFRAHEIFLPEVLLAAKAMYAGLDLLKPLFIKEKVPMAGKVVIGTVRGDLHDIGKNLVSIMLKGAGFDVIDLGKDVTAEKFIEAAEREQATIIGMSALLTTTMPEMKRVIDLLREQGLDQKIKTIVGGAPLTEETSQELGADAYGYDAAIAVERVKALLGEA